MVKNVCDGFRVEWFVYFWLKNGVNSKINLLFDGCCFEICVFIDLFKKYVLLNKNIFLNKLL